MLVFSISNGGKMAAIEKRKNADGTTSYRAKVRLKGFEPVSASFTRLTDARAWAAKTEQDQKNGRYFGQSKRHTLSELIDRYTNDELHKLKSASSVKVRLKFWKTALGLQLLSDLTPDVIQKARDTLKATPKVRGGGARSGADVNRTLAALSSALSYGSKELGWIEVNPLARVRKFSESKGRVRYLSDVELPKLLAACKASSSPHLLLAVCLALSTGARKSEVLSLQWGQVDLKAQTALLGDTKNGDARALPVVGTALQLLTERAKVRNLHDDRIFPPTAKSNKSDYFDLRSAWDTACKTAQLEDFHWHDLRHTAASYLAMSGVTPLEISKLLGHRTMAMVSRYAHLAPGRKIEISGALAERLGV
jgi:integrase